MLNELKTLDAMKSDKGKDESDKSREIKLENKISFV